MRRVALLVISATLLVVAAPVQAASPPQPVRIVSNIFFPEGNGDFTANPAGPICSAGTVTNLVTLFVGFQSNRAAQIIVRHQFTCGDGSGSFVLQLTVRLDFQTGATTFTWSVLSGTGEYVKLHGSGTGSGTPLPGGTGVVDTYTGGMHID
jgi:hypothetical protein